MSGKDRAIDFINSLLMRIEPFRGVILVILFVIAIFTGIVFLRSVNKPAEISIQEPTVSSTISSEDKSNLLKHLTIDISGGVKTPGVYSLIEGSRIIDALEKADGLSVDADMVVIEKSINLAELVTDGQKLYFPKKGDQLSAAIDTISGSSQATTGKISINRATLAELDSLPGIGEVRSKAIIANRPYYSTQDLITKKVISNSVYQDIKELISL